MTLKDSIPFPVSIHPDIQGGAPCIQGQRIRVERLLDHLLWVMNKHRKLHPGSPYDLSCIDWWRATLQEFCNSYPSVSQDVAGEALGFVLMALAQRALDRPATVLKPAIQKALKEEA